MGLTPEEYGFTPEEFCEIKASTPKNSISFYSTPKEILNFYNLPLDNTLFTQPGGGVRILNAIAQWNFCR